MPHAATYVVKFKYFSGDSWDQLFAKAADFASSVGPDRVINISHSEHLDANVVAVWYRGEASRTEDA